MRQGGKLSRDGASEAVIPQAQRLRGTGQGQEEGRRVLPGIRVCVRVRGSRMAFHHYARIIV